ncbi:MAG: hypothetical protein I3274_02760 [Candidatus Moeniiplasma glomeromycotorum]|nr:hypothetical protein [Candidatus Moeniiplasma glomeromycotorum]MCE8167526.1 hypothetical protein [Candidatus Moeniiplasma glomeromycotorum]
MTANLFTAYPRKNFPCSRCQEQFTNQTLYSVTNNPEKIPYYSTYCWACAATLMKSNRGVSVKKTMSKPKVKKSTQRSKTLKKKNTSKKLRLVPTPTKSKRTPRTKHSPVDYYNCLMNYAQAGFYDSQEGKLKIHSCCKKCKQLAPSLNTQRDKEVVKLISSYKQVGESLAKLLQPTN